MSKIVLLNAAKELRRNHGFGPIQLQEAIPYIREFQHKIMVVKVGGSVLDDGANKHAFFEDVVFMADIGVRVILVHGGSRHLSKRMKDEGITPVVENGQRKTDKKTLELAVDEFNKLNLTVVEEVKAAGGRAVGFPAGGTPIVQAKRLGHDKDNFVGKVTVINTDALMAISEGYVPVVTCIGASKSELFNINADDVAGAIAGAMKAEKLILLTDKDGVNDEGGNLMATMTFRQVKNLIAKGVIKGGMVPKVNVCLDALRQGVKKTHIINGSTKDSLLCEVFTDKGIGTEIVAAKERSARRSA
jgi:acetylglutamate kinase